GRRRRCGGGKGDGTGQSVRKTLRKGPIHRSGRDMTPGARVAATIELLDEIVSRALAEERGRPADLVANAFCGARGFIGGGDRRAVSERVWGVLRRYGQLTWWLERTRHPGRDGRAIVSADLMLVDGMSLSQVEALFDGGRYRPAPLEDSEIR